MRIGEVETVNSAVVGEGRRVRRWGCVVSIPTGDGSCCSEMEQDVERSWPYR